MNSKERVRLALTRKAVPDRVPIQFDLCKSLIEHFSKELSLEPEYALSYYEDLTYRISANAIRTTLGSDVVVVGGTVACGFTPIPVEDDITMNEFGMKMKPTNLYVEVVEPPLKNAGSIQDVEQYNFPDPNAKGRFNIAQKEIEKYGNDYFIIGDCELSIFELAWQLTGLEKHMMAMAMQEQWLEPLYDKVECWTTQLALQQVKLGVDAIWFGEDLGTQTSTLMSPDMWCKLFKPRYIRMFELLKKENPDIIIIMHSDGAVATLLDNFIEIGVDVYNPVQPNVPGSDPKELKENYGDSIAFFGGIDQQQLLPEGDIEKIRSEVKYRCQILGENGGYLLAPAHVIQADVKPEVVKVMVEAVKEFGKY
ncbi:MAG: uroporphyrinogen decarboxylase family protein [Planctomycetota bacterium]|jgi:uroporphyrinogen decarboxylase